jgi:hypothetical protein
MGFGGLIMTDLELENIFKLHDADNHAAALRALFNAGVDSTKPTPAKPFIPPTPTISQINAATLAAAQATQPSVPMTVAQINALNADQALTPTVPLTAARIAVILKS